jgi:alpha-tubulin suppressor-like RCC1 family protein
MLDKIEIHTMSVGIDFVMLLSSNGILFTKGENRCGELGLDDYQPRNTLCPITFF